MTDVRRLVLDVLKPHDPPLLQFTDRIASTESVEAATATVLELDEEVQNVSVTIEGEALDFDAVERSVEDLGATIHSVDQVACGTHVVERRPTPQDS